MSQTDLAVLEQLLAQQKAQQYPNASDAEFWEFFSAEQILRDYQLDPEEIKSGVVGQESNKKSKGTDGGIDSMYLIVNGKLIRDLGQARDLANHKGKIQFDIIIIQSKKGGGFDLATLIRLGNTSESIFQIEQQPANFAEKYNSQLLDTIVCFREAHKALLTRHPTIGVFFYHVCSGDTSLIDTNVGGKARELEQKVRSMLPTVNVCEVKFFGAREIITLFRKPRKSTFALKCVNSITDGNGGYVALVELGEFFKLLSENGVLREYLFESNVRDYEGDVEVNKQIGNTLQNPQPGIDFWWLNNGITIVTVNVTGHSQELVLDDPQIVNGLQTSQVIFDCLKQPLLTSGSEKRHVAIRIIKSPDNAVQDKIIRATNSQTKIPIQFLRASDEKQRDIEQIFRASGLHYDRRKNSWRTAGRNLDSVVGMTELAQSVAAIILQEPDHARARPSRYFKDHYDNIFKPNIQLNAYVVCALLRKRAEVFLKTVESEREDRNNLLFYVIMTVRPILLKKRVKNKAVKLHEVNVQNVDDECFRQA